MRRRWVVIGGVLLAAVAAAAGVAGWAVFRVPAFYEKAAASVQDPVERKAASDRFVEQTNQLADEIQHSDEWSQTFTPLQINSWLAEELPTRYARHIPPGVSDPRVHIDDGVLLIGFRYEAEAYNGVVSIRLRPAVPEDNRLFIEIESVRAGLLPISVKGVLDTLTRRLNRAGWPVEWTETNGNDVAIVSLDQAREHRAILESVEINEEALRISGRRAAQTPGGPRTAYLHTRRMRTSRGGHSIQ